MSVVQLEPWRDKVGIAEFFVCSKSQIEKWQRQGMPSEIIAGKRKFKASVCEPWVLRYDPSRRKAS